MTKFVPELFIDEQTGETVASAPIVKLTVLCLFVEVCHELSHANA